MAEYIEREALLVAFDRTISELRVKAGKNVLLQTSIGFVQNSRDFIANVPAADVVEVVRCKDCTMWERNRISCEGRARCLTGEGGTRYRGRNDFCSIGIKMDGEGE